MTTGALAYTAGGSRRATHPIWTVVDENSRRRTASRGRPPYGYRLGATADGPDAEPEPDAVTAPIVRRIFRAYADGHGLQAIAEALTAEGVLCPSAYDRARNPHFDGVAWSKGTVRAILVNDRYADRAGYGDRQPLIDGELFARVQETFARKRATRTAGPAPAQRVYRFRGMLRCGYCNRAMQGSWNNGEVYYRCRFPENYADANGISHPRNVYLRERRLVAPLRAWLRATRVPPGGPAPEPAGTTPAGATPGDHVRTYERLGLKLTYLSMDASVRAKIVLPPHQVVRGLLRL